MFLIKDYDKYLYMAKKILLLASFTKDILIDENDEVLREQSGGPGLFLSEVFRREKINFEIKAPPIFNVKIVITPSNEFGMVPVIPKKTKLDFTQLTEDCLVVSTVVREFDFDKLDKFTGKVFLDIQGYVRDETDFGKKKIWEPSLSVQKAIFCLKGTDEELKYISSEFIEAQKKKILICTKGRQGAEIFYFGKKTIVKPKKVVKTENTIGAGDNFFGYFISRFLEMQDVVRSANYASDKVIEFLRQKEIS